MRWISISQGHFRCYVIKMVETISWESLSDSLKSCKIIWPNWTTDVWNEAWKLFDRVYKCLLRNQTDLAHCLVSNSNNSTFSVYVPLHVPVCLAVLHCIPFNATTIQFEVILCSYCHGQVELNWLYIWQDWLSKWCLTNSWYWKMFRMKS
jgi:hypothetical protein